MHIVLLSRSRGIYTTRRLVEAGRAAGHKVRVLDPLKCEMLLGPQAKLFYRRKELVRTDVCIPRIAQSIQNYGLAVVNQFAQGGIPVMNSAAAIAQSRNKMRGLQLLSANGIAVPRTVMACDAADLKEMVSLVGGVPVLIKLLQGGDRSGVMVCETLQSMEAALEALLGLGHNLVVQQYVREARGRDVRALVVGGRVVAAVWRTPRVGRLGRTLGTGAKFRATRLKPEFERIAVATANLFELEVAAVDMLDQRDGPKVFEVNSSPGIKEIEDATGIDVAAAMVARAEELAQESGRWRPVPRPPAALKKVQKAGSTGTIPSQTRSGGSQQKARVARSPPGSGRRER